MGKRYLTGTGYYTIKTTQTFGSVLMQAISSPPLTDIVCLSDKSELNLGLEVN